MATNTIKRNDIFMYKDYTAEARTFANAVKAGEIYPSNDANALGVVLYDVEAGATGAIMTAGHVAMNKCYEAAVPTANAKSALKAVHFYPQDFTTDTIKVVESAGEVEGASVNTVAVYLAEQSFKAVAETTSNWTALNATVNSVVVSNDHKIAYVTFTAASAGATAKNVTLTCAAAAAGCGVAPTAAVQVATVKATA